MFRKGKLSFLIAAHWLIHALRIYTGWSLLYRFIYHREFLSVELDSLDPDQASTLMKKLEWRPDRWKELMDAVGSPQWVQHCLNEVQEGRPQPLGALDCDDFSAWSANCISSDYEPCYFTTSWLSLDGTPAGHAVCLFFRGSEPKKLYHTGNWGIRGPFENLNKLSQRMIKMGGGVEPIGWSIYTKNMKLIDFGKGMPPEINLIDKP